MSGVAPAVVLDCGTVECRVGLAGGTHAPQAVLATRLGRRTDGSDDTAAKAEAAMAAAAGLERTKPPIWYGAELDAMEEELSVTWPVSAGRVTDWVR